MICGAVLSADAVYRYRLWRAWDDRLPRLPFLMLNPSTADGDVDDPTIRKCLGFAKQFRCGGIDVVNLFAYRATKPTDLRNASDPVGPSNDDHIVSVCKGKPVICAWGTWGRVYHGRVKRVMDLLASTQAAPFALATTADGYPRHPLMLAYAAAKAAPFSVV